MIYDMMIGTKKTGYRIVSDAVFPKMWRVADRSGQLPEGSAPRLSDMVNLPRAKAAALSFARPEGLGSAEKVRWVLRPVKPSGMAAAASHSDLSPQPDAKAA